VTTVKKKKNQYIVDDHLDIGQIQWLLYRTWAVSAHFVCSSCNNFEPHSSNQICSALLSGMGFRKWSLYRVRCVFFPHLLTSFWPDDVMRNRHQFSSESIQKNSSDIVFFAMWVPLKFFLF
jgi:hypothetical protein